MKQFLVLILMMVLLNVQAQHKALQFGFGGSVNAGWFATNIEQYSNNGVRFGGSWGLILDVFMMEGVTFTTGFTVDYINGTMTMPYVLDSVGGNIQRIFKTKYLEIPLILTLKTKNIKDKVRIYGQVGFGLGFLLSAKANDSFTSTEGTKSEYNTDIYNDLSFMREALILGLGIEIPLRGSSFIRTGFRFNNGFVNILKGYNQLNPDIKNNGRNNFLDFDMAFIF